MQATAAPAASVDALFEPQNPPRGVIRQDIECLTEIFDEAVNLAIWQRPANPVIERFAQAYTQQSGSAQRFVSVTAGEQAGDILPEWAKSLPGADVWLNDVEEVIDIFHCLFEPAAVGVRLHTLSGTMCPRFHVDRVPARLLITYCGRGTEWLPEACVSRNSAEGRLPEQQVTESDINEIPLNAIALLKGELWEGNEGRGLIHRSPDPKGTPRLVLGLDWLS